MKTNRIGDTDLVVSEIALGTTGIGGHNLFVNIDEVDSATTVRRAWESGVSFFDTADYYGLGRAETLLGKILPREAVIASKGGLRWNQEGKFAGRDISPAHLRNAVTASLRRLGRDVIDLYYLHAPDGKTDIADAFGELVKMRDEGKIRYLGVSNVTLEELEDVMEVGSVAAVQSQFSLFDRRPARSGMLAYCQAHGIAFIPYGVLAFGILGGKYRRDFRLAEHDWRNNQAIFDRRNYPYVIAAAHRLRDKAARMGVPLTHVAIRWVLQQPAVPTALVGAKHPEQIEDNAMVTDFSLSSQEMEDIEQIVGDLRIF
ncbi:MAG: aldo/keto reductase [Candidatus Lernaella stagnicola]|nr:aldo/keto reductase [Candidatus Lernaella stagnicola]